MTSISSDKSIVLELPPSCIAFCPFAPDLFVIGTYYLHPKQDSEDGDGTTERDVQKRSGSLILFELRDGEISHVATEPTSDFAVLDLQWSPHDTPVLAVATSTGSLAFYKISSAEGKTSIRAIGRQQLCDSTILALSLAWHPTRTECIFVTLSDGRVCVCTSAHSDICREDAQITVKGVYQHSLEAWCLAYIEGHDQRLLYSGGDDATLQCGPLNPSTEETISIWQDRKLHAAGVTAILPLSSDLVVTGSYDDHVRLISAPLTGRRRILAEKNLGGGVWRLKALTKIGGNRSDFLEGLTILASCMHAGTRVIRLRRTQGNHDKWDFEILAKFEEHKSMNYGSDAQLDCDSVWRVVSTSFYDKLLCLWRFDPGSNSAGSV